MVYNKIKKKACDFPSIPKPQACRTSHIINITQQKGTFFTKGKPTLTNHDYPKSIIYLWFTLIIVYSVVWNKCIMTYSHHYDNIQNIFIALIFSVLCLFISIPNLLLPKAITDLFYLLHSFAFSIMSLWYVLISDGLLSLSNMHLKVIYVFLMTWQLISFIALINIILSGCTTVYSSIHLVKDFMVASKFGQL